MTGIVDRIARYQAASDEIHFIATSPGSEKDHLVRIEAVLVDMVREGGLFPNEYFPVLPGPDGGGLYRLVEFPDRRGSVYVSVGVACRQQPPHRHKSWALVAGISGGAEENIIYRAELDEGGQSGALTQLRDKAIGPGEVEAVHAGEYHAIKVESDTPVLHLHVYDYSVNDPFQMPIFDTREGGSYSYLDTTKFDPPYPAISAGEAADAVFGGGALLLVAGDASPAAGEHIRVIDADDALAKVETAGTDPRTVIIVQGTRAEAHAIGVRLGERGHPLILVVNIDR